MRFSRTLLFLAAGLVLLGSAGQSAAQDNVVARASLYKDLQFGFPYAIRLYDDTRMGRAARGTLEDALGKKGVLIDPQGVFRIDLAVERISASFSQAKGSLGFVGTTDNNEITVDNRLGGLELTMNVWSSRQDSLLGGRRAKGSTSSSPFVHINAIVRDNETREVVWQGDALAPIYRADEEGAAIDAAEALAQVFGKSGTYPEE